MHNLKLDDFRKICKLKGLWQEFSKIKYVYGNSIEKDKEINKAYLDLKNGIYFPEEIKMEIVKDKGFGVGRRIPIFSIRDYCVYYYSIKKIETYIAENRTEGTFGGWPLGGEIRKSENKEIEKIDSHLKEVNQLHEHHAPSSWVCEEFNPELWKKAYGDYNALIDKKTHFATKGYIAEFDIANFYDTINIDFLELKLRNRISEKDSQFISILMVFLKYWNRKNNSYLNQRVGIPQDYLGQASRILANFYLQEYDKEFKSYCDLEEVEFIRFADDQTIICKSYHDCEKAIAVASKFLNRLGLNINQKKVRILPVTEYRDEKCFELYKDFKTNINNPFYFEKIFSSNLAEKQKNQFLKALLRTEFEEVDYINKYSEYFLDEDFIFDLLQGQLILLHNKLNNKELFFEICKSLSQTKSSNSFHFELINTFIELELDYSEIENDFLNVNEVLL
jgi:hypothetical protein